jgi:hypothetical protein
MSVKEETDDGLEMNFIPFKGILGDIKRRLPHYVDDYKKGFSSKVLASILFLFFACLANAIAFGGLTGLVTGNEIGTIEMIIATAAGGIVFAIFSGQPLTILGGTGPIVIFTGLLYQVCESFGYPFLPVYAWVGLWSSLFMIICAVFNTSAIMSFFTRFTDEIFAALIAVIFIVEAVKDMSRGFFPEEGKTMEADVALLTLLLGLGTYVVARILKNFSRTPYTSRGIRNFISDFGPAIAIAVMTILALQLPDVTNKLSAPTIPAEFTPTFTLEETGKPRPWLIDLWVVETKVILFSIVPALMATILLFLDQNITTRIVNSPGHRLTKGAGYHLDLLVVGIITGVCSIFGLPWIVAATVHAVNHVKSLANMKVIDQGDQKKEVIDTVIENRISPLIIHVMIAIALIPAVLSYIQLIPMAVLFGLFLFMGFATLNGIQFWERIMLWVTDKTLYPNTHYVKKVPIAVINKFTIIQVAGLVGLWIVKSAKPWGIFFPIVIAMLVPLRLYLNKVFKPEHLNLLDSEEEEDEIDENESHHV